MRVTSVDVYSANVEEPISFGLQGSEPDAHYQVRNIDGLDPGEIVPKFYGSSISGNSRYYDFGMKSRNLVFRVALNPNDILGESYSDVRDRLQRAISSTRTGGVRLEFKSGATIVAGISGYFSKFEVGYFNKLPEVQLTITCDDPMFRGVNPVMFEPEDLTDNPIIIPDTLSTSPHGFAMQLTCTDASDTFTIQDAETDPEWQLVLSPDFEVGDVLYISSEFSDKYIYLIRGGDTYHLADSITSGSIWPIIFPFPSENHFYIPEMASFEWNSLSYYAAYWGV
jgi:hypothetical protein